MKTILYISILLSIAACNIDFPFNSYTDNYNAWLNGQDTIQQPVDSIVQPPVCDTPNLIHLSDTNFVTLSASFDFPLMILGFKYYYSNTLYPDLITLMQVYWP